MSKYHGQNLVEFSIIAVLVIIGVIIAYKMLGNNINQIFTSSNSNFKQYKPFDFGNNHINDTSGSSNTGDSEGTSSTPASTCNNGNCTIDFGDYELSGVPENFNQFITANGASGGSDKLSDMMSQIAEQLEEEGLKKEAQEVKKLASLGHNMAAVENAIEDLIISCNYDKNCISSYKDKMVPKPENYDETYIEYKEISYNNALKSILIGGCGSTGYDNLNSLAPMYLSVLDSIKGLDNVSSSTKNVIEELTWDIGVVGEDFQNNVDFFTNWSNTDSSLGTNTFTDPITYKKTIVQTPDNIQDNFVNYNASKITNIDSSLICASGKGNDTGIKCH